MWGVEIAVMAVMIVFNGVFAAYEIALASISLTRLHTLAQQGKRGAKAAVAMKTGMEGTLAAVQLGITLVGAVAAATAGAGAEEQIAPAIQSSLGVSRAFAEVLGIIAVVFPLTIITIIFGELIPKVFALRNQELVCLRISGPMSWFSATVWPIVWFLESSVTFLLQFGERFWKTRLQDNQQEAMELQEIRASVALARTSRVIGLQEEKIILGATELLQRPVKEAMLPAEFISLIDANSTPSDALVAAHLDLHTRFPVTTIPGDPQGIIGYVIFKDLVAFLQFTPNEVSIRPIIRHINSFPDDMPAAQCLEWLIRQHAHIALIRDDEKNVVGMVTMEDMLEELVGEIEDEYDKLPAHAVSTGEGWIVGGGLGLEALKTKTGVALPVDPGHPDVRSISDWIEMKLDGPIRGTESITCETAKVTVRKCRRHKVMEAYVLPKKPPQTETATATPPV